MLFTRITRVADYHLTGTPDHKSLFPGGGGGVGLGVFIAFPEDYERLPVAQVQAAGNN